MDPGSSCVDSIPDIDPYLVYPDHPSIDQQFADQELVESYQQPHHEASPDLEEALLGIHETSIDAGLQENTYSDISDSDLTGDPTVSKPSQAEFSDISDCETYALEVNEQSNVALKKDSLDATNTNSIYSDISDTDDSEFDQRHASTISNQLLSTEYSDISDDNDTDRLVIDTRSCDTSVRSTVSVSFEMDSCISPQHPSMSESSVREPFTDVINNDKYANIQCYNALNQSESNADTYIISNNMRNNTLHNITDTIQLGVSNTASQKTTDIILQNAMDTISQNAIDVALENIMSQTITDTTSQNATDKSQNDTTTSQKVMMDNIFQNCPIATLQNTTDGTSENVTNTTLQNATDPVLQTIGQPHLKVNSVQDSSQMKSNDTISCDDNVDNSENKMLGENESQDINNEKETPQYPSMSETRIREPVTDVIDNDTHGNIQCYNALNQSESNADTYTTSNNIRNNTLHIVTDTTQLCVTDTASYDTRDIILQNAMDTISQIAVLQNVNDAALGNITSQSVTDKSQNTLNTTLQRFTNVGVQNVTDTTLQDISSASIIDRTEQNVNDNASQDIVDSSLLSVIDSTAQNVTDMTISQKRTDKISQNSSDSTLQYITDPTAETVTRYHKTSQDIANSSLISIIDKTEQNVIDTTTSQKAAQKSLHATLQYATDTTSENVSDTTVQKATNPVLETVMNSTSENTMDTSLQNVIDTSTSQITMNNTAQNAIDTTSEHATHNPLQPGIDTILKNVINQVLRDNDNKNSVNTEDLSLVNNHGKGENAIKMNVDQQQLNVNSQQDLPQIESNENISCGDNTDNSENKMLSTNKAKSINYEKGLDSIETAVLLDTLPSNQKKNLTDIKITVLNEINSCNNDDKEKNNINEVFRSLQCQDPLISNTTKHIDTTSVQDSNLSSIDLALQSLQILKHDPTTKTTLAHDISEKHADTGSKTIMSDLFLTSSSADSAKLFVSEDLCENRAEDTVKTLIEECLVESVEKATLRNELDAQMTLHLPKHVFVETSVVCDSTEIKKSRNCTGKDDENLSLGKNNCASKSTDLSLDKCERQPSPGYLSIKKDITIEQHEFQATTISVKSHDNSAVDMIDNGQKLMDKSEIVYVEVISNSDQTIKNGDRIETNRPKIDDSETGVLVGAEINKSAFNVSVNKVAPLNVPEMSLEPHLPLNEWCKNDDNVLSSGAVETAPVFIAKENKQSTNSKDVYKQTNTSIDSCAKESNEMVNSKQLCAKQYEEIVNSKNLGAKQSKQLGCANENNEMISSKALCDQYREKINSLGVSTNQSEQTSDQEDLSVEDNSRSISSVSSKSAPVRSDSTSSECDVISLDSDVCDKDAEGNPFNAKFSKNKAVSKASNKKSIKKQMKKLKNAIAPSDVDWSSLGVHRCRHCNFMTESLPILQAHACKLSSVKDPDIASVQTSIIKSGGVYICSHCKVQCDQFNNFWNHFERHLPKNGFLYKCCHCNVIFQLRGEAKIHSQSHLVAERKVEKIFPVGVKYIFSYMENGDWWRLHGLLRESLPSSVTPALVIENNSSHETANFTANESTALNSDQLEVVSFHSSSGMFGQKSETSVMSPIKANDYTSVDVNRDCVPAASSEVSLISSTAQKLAAVVMLPVSKRVSTNEDVNRNAVQDTSPTFLSSIVNRNHLESVSLLSSTGQKSTGVVLSPIKTIFSTGVDVNRYVIQNPPLNLLRSTSKSNTPESSSWLTSTGQVSTAFQPVPLVPQSDPANTCRNLFPQMVTNSSLTTSVLLYRADGSASSGILVPIQAGPGNSNVSKQVNVELAVNNNGIYVPLQSSSQSKNTLNNSLISAAPLANNKTQSIILLNPGILNTAVSSTAVHTNTANLINAVPGTSDKCIVVLSPSSTVVTPQQVTTSSVSLSPDPATLMRKALEESSPTKTATIIPKLGVSLNAISVSASQTLSCDQSSLVKMATVIPRTHSVQNQDDDVMCNKIKRQFCLAKPLTNTHFIDHSKSALEIKTSKLDTSMEPESNNKNYTKRSADVQGSNNACDSSQRSDINIEEAEENELGLKIAATFSLRKGPVILGGLNQNKIISESETELMSKDSSSKTNCASNTVTPSFTEVENPECCYSKTVTTPQRLVSTTEDKSATVTTSVVVSKMTHNSCGSSKDGQSETVFSNTTTPLPSAVVLASKSVSNSSSSSIENENLHKTTKPNSFYICAFQSCFESFETAEIFQVHLQTNHAYATFYPCAHCHQKCASQEELFHHMAQHTSPKEFRLFQCAFKDCSYFTNNITSFRNHCRIHHPDEENYHCEHCKNRFEHLSSLLDHFKLSLLKFIHCPYCSMKSTDKHDVLIHINGTHVGKPKQITVSCELACKPRSEQNQINNVASDTDLELITMRTSSTRAKKDLLLSKPVIKTEPPDTYEQKVVTQNSHKSLAVPGNGAWHTYALPKQADHHGNSTSLLDSSDNSIQPTPVQEQLCSGIASEVPATSKSTSSMVPRASPACSNSTSPDDSLGSAPFNGQSLSSQMDKVTCMLCLKQFTKIEALKKHLQIHSNKISEYTLFKCSVCSYHSMSLPPLARHWVGAHPRFGRMRFTKVQEKILPRTSDSTLQLQSKSRSALDQPQAKLLSCPHCKFSCLAQNVMFMHIWQAHPKGNQEPDPAKKNPTTSVKSGNTPKKQALNKQNISQKRKELHENIDEKQIGVGHMNTGSKQILSVGGNIPKQLPDQISLAAESGSSTISHILTSSTAYTENKHTACATTDQPVNERHSSTRTSEINEQMSAKDVPALSKQASPKTIQLNTPSKSVSPSRPVLPSSKTPVPLECKYCIYEATRVIELSNHLAECHKAASVKCSLCTFRGKKLLSIIHHFYQIHGENLDTIAYEIDSTPFVECAPDNVQEAVSTKQEAASIAVQSRKGYTFHYRCNICAHKCPKSSDIKTHIKKRHGSHLIREYSRFVPEVNTPVARTSPSKTVELQNRLETSVLQASNVDILSNPVVEKENDKDLSHDSNEDLHDSLKMVRFRCSHCRIERKYETGIKYHITHTHGKQFAAEFTKVRVNLPSPSMSSGQTINEDKSPPLSFSFVYRCNICALRILSKQNAIQQHLREQHGEDLIMEYSKYKATSEIIAQMQQVKSTVSLSNADRAEKASVKEKDVCALKEISKAASFLINSKAIETIRDQNTEKDVIESNEDESHSVSSKAISQSLECDSDVNSSATIENRSKGTETSYKCTVCQIRKTSFEEMKIHLIQSHAPVFEAECQKSHSNYKKDSIHTKNKEAESSRVNNDHLSMKTSTNIKEGRTSSVNNPHATKSISVTPKEGETPDMNNPPVSNNISMKQKTKETKVIPHFSNAKSMTFNYRCNICAVKLKCISDIRDHLIDTHGEHLIREYTRFRIVKDKPTDIVLLKENEQVYKSTADKYDSSASGQTESQKLGSCKQSLISPGKNKVTSLREETSSSDDNDANDSQLSFNSDNSFSSSSSYRRLILKPDKRLVAPVRKLSFPDAEQKSPNKHHYTKRPTSRKTPSNGICRDPVVILNKQDVDQVNVTDEDKVKQKFSSLVAKKFTAPRVSQHKSHLYGCNKKTKALSIQMELHKISKEIEEIRKSKAQSKKSRTALISNDSAQSIKPQSDEEAQNSTHRSPFLKNPKMLKHKADDPLSDDSAQSPKKKSIHLAQSNDLSTETRTTVDGNSDADQGIFEESHSTLSESPSNKLDPCGICYEVLANRHSLFRHYFIHLNYKPYVCAYCSIHFRSKSVLDLHTNKAHPGKNVYMKYERNEKKEKAARKLACYPAKKNKNIKNTSIKVSFVDKTGDERPIVISKHRASSKDVSGRKISKESDTHLSNNQSVEEKNNDFKDQNETTTVINAESLSVKSKDSILSLKSSPTKQNSIKQISANGCTTASKAKKATVTATPRSKPSPCLFLQHIMFHREMSLRTLTEEQVCNLCEERFGNAAAVRHHLYTRHMPHCYKCPYCSFRSYPKGVVRKHVNRMHRDQPPVVVMVRDKAYFEFEKFYNDKYGNLPEVIRQKETYAAHQKRTAASSVTIFSSNSPAIANEKSPQAKCTVSDLGKKLSESLAKKIIYNGKKAFSDMFKQCDSLKTDINSKTVPQKRKTNDCNLAAHPAKILHLETDVAAKHDRTRPPSPTPNTISNIFEMWTNTNSSQPADVNKITSCDFNAANESLDKFHDSPVSIIPSQDSDCISISSDVTESDSDFDAGSCVVEKRTIYCCHLCSYTTPILSRFEAHLSNVENFAGSNILHKCGFCRFTTDNDAEFSSHISKHICSHPYFCPYCRFSSFYSKTVRSHCRRLHSEKILKVEHRSEDSFPVSPRKNNVSLRPVVRVQDIMTLDPEEFDTLANDSGAAVVDLHDLSPDKVSSALRAIGVDDDSYNSYNDDNNSSNNGDVTDDDSDNDY